ncbi:MAG: NADPH-dependent assimilatory sulfite reductase hemoprotein subunit [Marinobacter sp.]|uniref:NADPH-dependent assimilatory sulfite reductase hemoprotein subunit n=1 Tax=Marinobacter sp. AC-23 TaxID=1879031 RepID=UPI0008DC9F15|nr:NADPH-dependent assimilatory sulfite reductase hemoprotein subunit [Marinobacter sp. AC-23]OHY79567.1 sulfite reductase subunit beta [Marinobacter sp. AC-23]
MSEKLPEAEVIKRESNYLRGTILEGLADRTTGALPEDDTKLTKFHGSYQQDDREVRDERRRQKLEPLYQFMVRLRLPGGVLTTDQWLGLDKIADECADSTLRLTTRQTFQFHGVFKEQMQPFMQKIHALGLDSRGACGDVNRNVISNVNPHQSQLHGEIHELSLAISERLRWRSAAYAEIWLGEECVEKLGEEEEPFYGHKYLPRKFKIALAVPPENDCDVFANDIGLIAIVEEGEILGFNVVVGGGMGLTYGDPATYPRLATMAGYVPKGQIVDACEAICAIQRDFGDRTNRAHARFKYTIDDHGMDWFQERFAEYHGQAFERPRSFSLSRNGDRFGWVEGEDGNQHLTLLIPTGRVADTENGLLRTALRKIAEIHAGSFRITCNQNLVIANVLPEKKAAVDAIVEEYKLDAGNRSSPLRQNSMACVAFPTCGLAMAEAERFLPEFVTRVEQTMAEEGLEPDAINLRITGCPNGCARPYLGEIALTGKAPGKYNLYLGADFSGQRMNRLYRENIDTDTILSELQPLFRAYQQERKAQERFGDFLVRVGIVEQERTPAMLHQSLK